MPAGLGTERPTVQDPLIQYAVEIGWTYLPRDEAVTLRKGEGGTLLYRILREKLIALNPGLVTVTNVDEVISRVDGARNTIEGNAEVLAWIRGERSIYAESEKRQRNVTVVDFNHADHNIFHVTDEWEYTNGKHSNRADILFLINGIPVAIVETKSARRADAIEKGIEQVRRYHRETPEMLTAPQVFDVTHLIDFYYGVTWNLDRKDLSNWKDEQAGNFERKVKAFFSRERFLTLLGEWIVFFTKDDELRKIILKQHQTRAVGKCVERALDPSKQRGLVWHTQGSGKTFTMMKVAEAILDHTAFSKPTVVMLVDRNELETQLFANLTAYGLTAEVVTSKKHLRQLLSSDHRGLIVSMIHKFDQADADLCTRKNVFVLVDEAHRSTGGTLGNYLVGALPYATIIGFTGTPIDRTAHGQGTFKTFGKDDSKGYLDKYSIAESIRDGTTVELHYTLAPNDIRVPRDLLEREFLDLMAAQGVSDIDELNHILDRAVQLKTFLKAKDRVEHVASFVADHFKNNVEPLGYKAFLVGVDREACALYKEELDKLLPADYSTVVYTSGHGDDPKLRKHHLGEDQEKAVRRAFVKAGAQPKILIVTEKLLTGFDAPILYCMYLDKPMRDHTLLQAIARVNRPYEDADGVKKPAGLVVDFVGIFEKIEKALAFDSDVVQSVIHNLDVLKDRFSTLISHDAPAYLAVCAGPITDKTLERAIDAFTDKDKRQEFFTFFRELETLYEIISPDPFLRPHVQAYEQLALLYQIVRNAFSTRPLMLSDLMRKTEELVKAHVTSAGIEGLLAPVKLDEKALQALKDADSSPSSKVINLAKCLTQAAQDDTHDPLLVPIGERAEAIMIQYDDRQVSTEQALQQLESLLDQYVKAQRERERTGMDSRTFNIYWLLTQEGVATPDIVAAAIMQAIQKYEHYRENARDMRMLKAELYKVLLPTLGKDRMVAFAERLLTIA